jgi:signal transduction histidine kinase/CheY-like chemotaxis protein
VKIRTQLILYTSLIILLVGGTIAFGVIRSLKTHLLNNFEKDSIHTHELIASNLIDPLYNLDIGQLQAITKNARIHPNIASIIVLDHEGYILTDGTEDNELQDEELTSALSQKIYQSQNLNWVFGENDLEVGAPVTLNSTQLKGYLFIKYDLLELKNTIKDSTTRVIYLSIICLLFGGILSLALSQQVVKPITRLITLATDIGSGNLEVHAKHEKGELGILSLTLQEMAQNLQASMFSKDSLNAILDNIPSMIFVLNNDYQITQVNIITETQLNSSKEDILGRDLEEIIPEFKSIIHFEEKVESLINFKGMNVPILFSSSKIPGVGYVCAAVDIALQKETVKVLKEATEEANKANMAKSSFLANMSHEIRTPLNSMIGYTDLLLEDQISHEQRDMINLIKQSSDTLLVLINDILDISKIEAGELILESAQVDLIDCVFEVGEAQRPKIKSKAVKINIDTIKLQDSHVYSDGTRMKQVFLNLISNAIKFTEKGEINITAETMEINKEFHHIKFSVTDSGIGMTEDQLKHIFEAFKQADSSTTRKYGGTGLGLNITKNIIQLMGSSISVSSEIGKGSTFYFIIKFKIAPYEFTHQEHFKKLTGKSIIVVGQSVSAQNILREQMNRASIATQFCQSQEELNKTLQSGPFDFILVNINSITNTTAFMENLSRLDFQGKCISLSSDLNNDTKDSNFHSYILKPARAEKIYQALINLIVNPQEHSKESALSKPSVHDAIAAHLLVVDDNKMNLMLVKKVLIKMGHSVQLANDGSEAVEIVKKQEFDMILMDMQMPVLDGPGATRAIRQFNIETPIIAFTANAFESDKQTCLEAGMNDYLTKPINQDKLKAIIKTYCNRSS